MEYLILNEASMPYATQKEAKDLFPGFLAIMESAFQHGFRSIRISEAMDQGWFSVPLDAEQTYFVRNWVGEQELTYKRKLKSFISKTKVPHIPEEELLLTERHDLSDFVLAAEPSVAVPSLGAAYLLEQLALSFASHSRWLPSTIALIHTELREEGEVEQQVEAKNCATWEVWEPFLQQIQEERIANLQKGQALWERRAEEFPNLIFCGKAEGQLKKLHASDVIFRQLWNALSGLNQYGEERTAFSLQDIKDFTGLNMSDESDTVKQNPRYRQLREFFIEGERIFFGYHVKNFSGGLRLHFFPDREKQVIYVGYFGNHLPTGRF